ncbi:MAG: hypothetical protein CMM93_06475 [Rickettsiales bacterium]|nr:hypothetical protein [Rickettsiales bacterium]|tara:strand:+ start:1252 stop:2073 length:822 start_codon:yes stop_codon:yes gene_type:complete
MRFVYANGTIGPESAAYIPVDDRGFRLGDGVFDTLPVHFGRVYQLDFHIERLRKAMHAIALPIVTIDWESAIQEVITRNAVTTGFVRITVSRGSGSLGYRPLPDIQPLIVIEASKTLEKSETQPLTLGLAQTRKIPLRCLPVNHKLTHGLNSMLALQEAPDCDDMLVLNVDDTLSETATANLFWIKDTTIFTPPLTSGCLNGATRHAVMRLHAVTEKTGTLEDIRAAEAVFITNSRLGVAPVSSLRSLKEWADEHPLITALRQAYRQDIGYAL